MLSCGSSPGRRVVLFDLGLSPRRTARLLGTMGDAYYQLGLVSTGEELLERAVEAGRKDRGGQEIGVGRAIGEPHLEPNSRRASAWRGARG